MIFTVLAGFTEEDMYELCYGSMNYIRINYIRINYFSMKHASLWGYVGTA